MRKPFLQVIHAAGHLPEERPSRPRAKLVIWAARLVAIATSAVIAFLIAGVSGGVFVGDKANQSASVDLAAIGAYSGDGVRDIPGIVGIFIGASLMVIAFGLRRKDTAWTWGSGGIFFAGGFCFGCGGPVMLRWLSPSEVSLSIPAHPGTSSTTCPHCVVFFTTVVLFPLLFNVVTVACSFTMQYIITVCKGWYNEENESNDDLLADSFRHPSMLFTVPVFVSHLISFCLYIWRSYKIGGWTGFHAFSMLYTNSGVMAYTVTGIFAFMLADPPDEYRQDGANCRLFLAYILFILLFPIWIIYMVPAMLKWFWFVLLVEAFNSLLILICVDFFKGEVEAFAAFDWLLLASQTIKTEDEGVKTMRAMITVYFFLLAPAFPLAKFICNIFHIEGAAQLSPGQQTVVSSFIIFTKTFSAQFYINAMALSYAGVGYWDVIPLVMSSRHWLCNACLLSANASKFWSIGGSAWQSFVSLFV